VVPKVPSGPAGDLSDLRLGQGPRRDAVELAQGREGDVLHIHVEAHADRVGRDQIVDLAGFVELDLGVARARAERAHDDRGATALPADQFRDRVDVRGREGDGGRARRQARQLLRTDIAQR